MSVSRIRSALSVLTAEALLLGDSVIQEKDNTIFTEEALLSIIRMAEVYNDASTVERWLQKHYTSLNNTTSFKTKTDSSNVANNATTGFSSHTENVYTVRKISPTAKPIRTEHRTSPYRRESKAVCTPSNSRRGSLTPTQPQKLKIPTSTISLSTVASKRVEPHTNTPIRATQRSHTASEMYGVFTPTATKAANVVESNGLGGNSSRPVSALRTNTTTPIRTISDLNWKNNIYSTEEGRYAYTPLSGRNKTALVINNGSSTKKKSPSLNRASIGRGSHGHSNNTYSRQSTGTSIGEIGGSSKDFENPVSYKELWHKAVVAARKHIGSTNVLLAIRLEILEELENILKEGSEELMRYTLHEKDYFCADSSHLMPLLTYQLKSMDVALLRRIISIVGRILNIAGALFAHLQCDTYIAHILWLMDCPIANEPADKEDMNAVEKNDLHSRETSQPQLLYDVISMHISNIVENVPHERFLCHLVEHLRWMNGSGDRHIPALVSTCPELTNVHSAEHPYHTQHVGKNGKIMNDGCDKIYLDFRSRSIAAHIGKKDDPTTLRYKRSKDLCTSLGFSILSNIASKTCLKVKYIIDDLICPNEFTLPFVDDFSFSDNHKEFAYPAPYWNDLKARRTHKKVDTITDGEEESVVLTAQPLFSGACPLELLRHSISLREKVSLDDVMIVRSSDNQELADGDVIYEMGLHPLVRAFEDVISRAGQELSAMITDEQKWELGESHVLEKLSKAQRKNHTKDKNSSDTHSMNNLFLLGSKNSGDITPLEMTSKFASLDNTVTVAVDQLTSPVTNYDFRHHYDKECLGTPLPGCSAILQTPYRANTGSGGIAALENTHSPDTCAMTKRASSHDPEYIKPMRIQKTRIMQGELRLQFVSAVASVIWETIILPVVGDTSRKEVPHNIHVLEVFMALFPVHCNHLFYTTIPMEQRKEVLKICVNREIKHLHNMPLFMTAMVDECPPELYEEYIKFTELPRRGKNRFRIEKGSMIDENSCYPSRPSFSKVLFVPLIDSTTEKEWHIYHRKNKRLGAISISASQKQLGGASVMRIPNKNVASSYVCRTDADAIGCGANMPNFLHMLGPAGCLTPSAARRVPIPLRTPSPKTFCRSRSGNSGNGSEPGHRHNYSIKTMSRIANPNLEGIIHKRYNKDPTSYNKGLYKDPKYNARDY